jgi:ABC-type glycerol-3-phosphate transport system substrate-binding protein
MTCPQPRRSPRSRFARVPAPLIVLLLAFTALLAGCSSSTATTEQVTAEELATAVTDTWTQAMQELVTLLEDKPDTATALPLVQRLKEQYVQRLIALGYQRETLSETDNARANSLELSAFEDLADEPWYASFNTIWSYYSGVDLELANLVASFNNLTQYSDFELLSKQLPQEATRLGIE